jgi:hypothetical protein
MHYLQNSKSYLGAIHRHTFKVKKADGTSEQQRTNCYVFNYEMLNATGVYLMDTGLEDPQVQLEMSGTTSRSSQSSSSGRPDDLPF